VGGRHPPPLSRTTTGPYFFFFLAAFFFAMEFSPPFVYDRFAVSNRSVVFDHLASDA